MLLREPIQLLLPYKWLNSVSPLQPVLQIISWDHNAMSLSRNRLSIFAAVTLFTSIDVVALPSPESGFEPFSFVNYETPHVRPMSLTPSGDRLLVTNTADNRLLVFSLNSGIPVLEKTIPVGVEPVSVNARTDNEAWVVNHLSDTVSVIDLEQGVVTETLETDDEPADVVFAGFPQRAFVSASQVNRINVFNPNALNSSPATITISGEDPRMLAVSPDNRTVYAAIFESGNGTTALAGGKSLPRIDDVVANPLGPYNGNHIIPNNGATFNPPLNPNNPSPPPVSIIVKKQQNGQWWDDNGTDWSQFVTGQFANLADRVQGLSLIHI